MEKLAKAAIICVLFLCSAGCVIYGHKDEAGYFAMGALFLIIWG